MDTIAILGTGLMGASLGLALKKRGVSVMVRACARREETRRQALEAGVADTVFPDPAEAVQGADLVVFCVPVLTIPELVQRCLPGLKPGAILTDVGSTKACLQKRIPQILEGKDALFVGSHPICGSEQQGITAGDADLYEGAMTVITAEPSAATEEISNLWKSVGSRVMLMDAVRHDEILAATSHLPHVVAAALVLSENGNGILCGSGFRDCTRIAEGSPQVWSDIVRTNAPALKEALKNFREHLDELDHLIECGDGAKLADWFSAARNKRKELLS
jgi:prephenate dehydrogenase